MARRRTLVLAAVVVPLSVRAEESHQGHTPASPAPTSHDWHGPLPTVEERRRAAATTPAAGYRAASERMHRDMDTVFAGDPDRDFVAALVPYGAGGIEMARVALRQARDPEVRALAESFIRSREEELETWRGLLARLPPSTTPATPR